MQQPAIRAKPDHFTKIGSHTTRLDYGKRICSPQMRSRGLMRFLPDGSALILDFGCDTSLSGLTFKLEALGALVGHDLSVDMPAKAAEKNAYRRRSHLNSNAPLARAPGNYAVVAATGMIGAGTALRSLSDVFMRGLESSELFVVSYNDHTVSDPATGAQISEWTDCDAAGPLFGEYGHHLPGKNMTSTINILEKK